jgi:hypothetical protein
MHIAKQQLSSCYVMATIDMNATTEELLEVMFSMRSVLKLYI